MLDQTTLRVPIPEKCRLVVMMKPSRNGWLVCATCLHCCRGRMQGTQRWHRVALAQDTSKARGDVSSRRQALSATKLAQPFFCCCISEITREAFASFFSLPFLQQSKKHRLGFWCPEAVAHSPVPVPCVPGSPIATNLI